MSTAVSLPCFVQNFEFFKINLLDEQVLSGFEFEMGFGRISYIVTALGIGSFSVYFLWLSAWASCQIRKIACAHAPGMPGTFSPSPQVSDPDMHHGTCVTHVPWCMPGSLTSGFLWNRRRGEMFPAFPAHAQPAILRIWLEAHGTWSEIGHLLLCHIRQRCGLYIDYIDLI